MTLKEFLGTLKRTEYFVLNDTTKNYEMEVDMYNNDDKKALEKYQGYKVTEIYIDWYVERLAVDIRKD